MNKTTLPLDTTSPHTWAVIAHNTILAYSEDEPDQEIWEQVSTELYLGYNREGKISHDVLCYTGKLINPDILEDDAELGNYAWILDEAVDYFTK